ncbi:hypothetical protein PCASD_15213 [Puccinia coronata f. sp. avenae]|uniref:Zinc finger PHD-type domain-containing protein n=1 Tax=Puccinia coronata f. sp. avenae TaxID=200324 RepID=A0A2N5T1F9_9BASI|nr:hypothetical protein PCASD_15213 [Puccinia coronata f. sp. avenae]
MNETQPEKNAQQLTRIVHPTEELPPPLRAIRRSVQLLSVSFFLNIFAPFLSIQNFAISKLEADLDGSQPDSYLPSLIPKLLVSLTGDRTTNYSNWESRLRREFLRREPHENPLGDEPARLKPKIPKRVVGYVYITEPIPLSTLPTPDDSTPQYPELANFKNGAHDQAPIDGQHPINPSYPPQAPETHRTEGVSSHTHQLNTPEPSMKRNSSPESLSSKQADQKDPHATDNHPTEESLRNAESLQPKPLTTESSECSSPAPQHLAGSNAITWSSLSPTIKLKALFKLCEWHFSTSHDLDRFRRLVDAKAYTSNTVGLDERFDWRQERCGLDSKGNQYWLSGQGTESRLWIQRREPQPPLKAITLRIPARAKKKEKNGHRTEQKRKYATQESSVTNRSRPSSSGAPPSPKRTKLTGTRSSQRIRAATQVESDNRSTSPRPTTMIVLKKTSASKNSRTPQTNNKTGLNGPRRPASRRKANDEVWQDVPPGWLDEVVEPTSKQVSTVFSSDLSEMSDDDEFVGDTTPRPAKQSKLKAAAKSLPNTSAPDTISTDESLSELSSDSPDASGDVSCESSSGDSNGTTRADEMEGVTLANDLNGREESMSSPTPGNTFHEGQADTPEETTLQPAQNGQNQQPSDLSSSNIPLSTPGESNTTASTNRIQQSVPVHPISEASPQLPTPNSNMPTANSTSCDAEKVESCQENSGSFFPELKGHPLDPEWIEWEVVCASIEDWRNFPLQFQKTASQSEKQLVELINDEVLPQVLAAHNEEEARKQKEEALAQRKRSSRLATREAVQATTFDADMMGNEPRMHSDRLEAKRLKEIELEESRKVKEEDQRLLRLKEREEKAALREAQLASERDAELKRAERARLRAESKLQGKAIKVARAGAENSVPSFDSAQHWELNCEICGVIGINMDDGSEVICCDQCEIWQHLVCHDRADEIIKRPKRDWATADFICSNCSGVPIARAVKKLRTHINGKPKPPPRQRASKVKDELNDSGPTAPGPSTTKPKITILMSNPNKLGRTTLNAVSPNPKPTNDLASTSIPSVAAGQRPMPVSSSAPSATPTGTTPAATAPDLTKYYDDLEKLCRILRMNTSLHRTLPTEVMHRLRRYLLDQQQRQRGHEAEPTPSPSSARRDSGSSLASNLHPSLTGQSAHSSNSPQPIHPHLQSFGLSHRVALDPQAIDPQLQQLQSPIHKHLEPLDTKNLLNGNNSLGVSSTPTPADTTTPVASHTAHNSDRALSESLSHVVVPSIPLAP